MLAFMTEQSEVHREVVRLRERLTEFDGAQAMRKLDMKKKPSISETLDWAKALVIMNAKGLGDEIVRNTLSTIAKYEGDLRKTEKELATFLERRKAELKATEAAAAAAPAEPKDGSDLLH